MDNIKVGLISLGCPKNLADSENMLYLMKESGMKVVTDAADADVIVVNTCAFIESAQKEAIDTILEMAQYKTEGSCKGLVVTGCLSELYETEIAEQLPEVDAFLGTGSYDMIVEAIKNAYEGNKYESFEDKNDKVVFAKDRVLSNEGHYAYLKIADGCDNVCSYCLIPQIRGIYRSRPMEEIVEEAKALAAKGVKELIVVAQDVTKYGVDLYDEYKLNDLLPLLNEIEGIEWIRLQYMYPERVHGDLLNVIKKCEKVVHYFDIPIQHANMKVLKKMGRLGNSYRLEILFGHIRRIFPDAVIRTSIIVGFPGEGEEEYNELKEFVKRVRFDRMGVFEFSPMEGTDAYHMRKQVPDEIKTQRATELMEIQAEISFEKLKERIGQYYMAIVDGFDTELNLYYGRIYGDSPEIDGLVYFGSMSYPDAGDFIRVKILDVNEHDMYACEVPSEEEQELLEEMGFVGGISFGAPKMDFDAMLSDDLSIESLRAGMSGMALPEIDSRRLDITLDDLDEDAEDYGIGKLLEEKKTLENEEE